MRELLKNKFLHTNPFYRGTPIVPENPCGRLTEKDYKAVDAVGNEFGDHHSGVSESGQRRWTPDHQPPTKLLEAAATYSELKKLMTEAGIPSSCDAQRLFPHSMASYRSQSGVVTNVINKAKILQMECAKV
jgi:hypothetical protein